MEKYTASYANTERNFVIQNLSYSKKEDEYYKLYCVVKNILTRGKITPPSLYLQKHLGKIDREYITENPIVLLSDKISNWHLRIKGYEAEQLFPARTFFYDLIPNYLPEYRFIQNLLLPEALITEIIDNETVDAYKNQTVDFYLPQANLVIEIDGKQHEESKQKISDNNRDKLLTRFGKKVIRLSASSISKQDKHFFKAIENIKSILDETQLIEEYRDISNNKDYYASHLLRLKYEVVMRYQLLILTLLQNGTLNIFDKTWNFSLRGDFPELEGLFELAFEDIFLWLEHVCTLSKLKISKPNLVLNDLSVKKSIMIDLSIFSRWDDEYLLEPSVIFIRNDYFEDRDYFKVSTSNPIKYNINIVQDPTDYESLKFFLKNLFGFDEFRDGQVQIISYALALNDCIGLLPTGSGKSLCYHFCCLLQPCINFVVAPLIALIYDQKKNLDEFGIDRTSLVTSEDSPVEKNKKLNDFGNAKHLLMWVSPERFQTIDFRKQLGKINNISKVCYAIIDEVHCVSEWGHDFRTSYLNLARTIRKYFPQIKFLGLTATATQFVLEDLKSEFSIEAESIKTVGAMDREELNFHIIDSNKNEKYTALVEIIKRINEKANYELLVKKGSETTSGLIFTVTARGKVGCIEVARKLTKDLNIHVPAYYGDLDKETKKDGSKRMLQEDYINDEHPLLVSTKAFGMGVNKKNIRYTIHYGLPWSIEAFYQEAGRAGRDGKEADCIILYSPETVSPAILNEIFDLNTNIPRMEELQNHLNSDLSPIMFLWRQNNDGVEKELELMRWVMLKLWNQKNSIIQCDQEHKKSKVEKAIYRLAILGFIEDWVILDWGEKTGVLEISVNNYNKETVKDHFQKYISRYESLFFSQEHANRNKAYHRIIKDKDERYYVRYMRAMLEWTYDHIAYSRRQAINHIRILCDRKLNSERLKLHINNYLQFSETTKLFDRIIEKPIDYKNWFLLLYDEVKPGELKSEGKQISVDKAENILASLQRYLESYRYNPGLNLLFVLLSIKCGQFWESGVYSRLEDAFITIESFGFETRNEIIDECLKFGVLLEDEKGKAILGEYFARGYPDKAMEIFEKLGDYGSFSVLLSRFAGKVGDTWKSII